MRSFVCVPWIAPSVVAFLAASSACDSGDRVDRCEGVGCSGHGRCIEDEGMPVCLCDDRYRNEGRLACVPEEATDADADVDSDVDVDGDGDADADEDAEGEACVDPVCDLWPQCGCPEDEKCTIVGLGRRACAPAGDGAHGAECVGESGCGAGTDCTHYAGAPFDQCFQYCNEDEDCAALGSGSGCAARIGDESTVWARFCNIPCDPMTGGGCLSGQRCEIFASNLHPEQFVAGCTGAVGTGTAGSPCTDTDLPCAVGHACLEFVGGALECRLRCVVGGDDCPPESSCLPFEPMEIVGGSEYGYCTT
jgi:hypothetical protein